jgi:asparagine synthase (glutamine-hydrolysing)
VVRQALLGRVGSGRVRIRDAAAVVAARGPISTVDSSVATVAWLAESLDGFVGTADACTVVGAGRLERLEALGAELGQPAGAGAGELVAEGYRRWQGRLPEHLHGCYAVAAWDHAGGTALVAVDRLGSGSIFVAPRDGAVLFSTELGLLLELLDVQPTLDRSAVASWLVTGTTPYGRTLYEGIHRLTDGESITVAGRIKTRRYWSPRYREPRAGNRRELAGELADAVRGAVARRMPASGGVAGIFLSGGLDSGAVAAMAQAIAPVDAELRGYSAVFPHHPTMDESSLVLELCGQLNLPGELIPVQTTSMLRAALDHLQAWRVPSPSPNLHFLRRLGEAACADGAFVVFDGEGGDELFGLAPFYLADLVRHGRLLRAQGLARRVPWFSATPSLGETGQVLWAYGAKGALPAGVHRLRRRRRTPEQRTPSWLNRSAAGALVTVDEDWAWKTRCQRDGPLWWRDRVETLIVGRQLAGAADHLRQILGRETIDAHPLLDDLDLIELVLRLPPDASFDAEFDRPLLREATNGLLPDSIRLRRDKTYFNQLFVDCLAGPDRPLIEALVGAPDARVNEYVRPDVVRSRFLDAPPGRRNGFWAWTTWRLLVLETWLRSLEDSRFPAQALEQLVAR